jgi:hypothetical protein
MVQKKTKQLIISTLVTVVALLIAFGLCYMIYLKFKYLIH